MMLGKSMYNNIKTSAEATRAVRRRYRLKCRNNMNDTVRTLSVFLLSCTLAVGSLLAVYLLVDKHYKARLAEDYAEIDSMKSELEKTRAEHLRWQQRYKQEPFEDYPYYVAETRWDVASFSGEAFREVARFWRFW